MTTTTIHVSIHTTPQLNDAGDGYDHITEATTRLPYRDYETLVTGKVTEAAILDALRMRGFTATSASPFTSRGMDFKVERVLYS